MKDKEAFSVEPRLRILVVTAERRLPDISYVYERLSQNHDLDIRVLSRKQQGNLRRALRDVDFKAYDRILFDILFRYIHKQASFIRRLSSVIIYEEDSYMNYLRHSRRYRQFSRFYRAVPGVRIVVTGAGVAERLRGEGFDANFLCKGYDERRIFCESEAERDIELGFVGRLGSNTYADRKSLLENLAANEPLQILRTEPGDPYRRMLNRIRYFVGADVKFGEYMAKNFEAMACGCVVLAWRQGSEEPAIGLEDGCHLLLYSSMEELRGHLTRLRSEPELGLRIAREGRRFAEQNLTFAKMAEGLEAQLCKPFPRLPERRPGFVRRGLNGLLRLFGVAI
ncbi:glycosyltransferase family protein [Stutzerimonas azotifigens]|uniref:glycosyltransferase family protein n=1 Tax=Stutzerimonas azotifigens TaxID=291995 RepID=UPI001F4340BA|nr:glycosyltransferase [Stutzerimonas azotifigens]